MRHVGFLQHRGSARVFLDGQEHGVEGEKNDKQPETPGRAGRDGGGRDEPTGDGRRVLFAPVDFESGCGHRADQARRSGTADQEAGRGERTDYRVQDADQ